MKNKKLSHGISDELISIKKLNIGNSEIEISIEFIPSEEQIKKTLTHVYDVINDIAEKVSRRGIDTSNWFYTSKQIKQLKKSPENNFI